MNLPDYLASVKERLDLTEPTELNIMAKRWKDNQDNLYKNARADLETFVKICKNQAEAIRLSNEAFTITDVWKLNQQAQDDIRKILEGKP